MSYRRFMEMDKPRRRPPGEQADPPRRTPSPKREAADRPRRQPGKKQEQTDPPRRAPKPSS